VETLGAGRSLDRSYIPTRYPNIFPAEAPMDLTDLDPALEAVELAQGILEYVGAQL
jgi:HEPN domain-containing protein